MIGFGIGIGCCLVYRWFQTKLLNFKYIEIIDKCTDSNKNAIDTQKHNNDFSIVNYEKSRTNFSKLSFFHNKISKNKKFDRNGNLNKKIKLCKANGIHHFIKYFGRFSRYKRSLCSLNKIQFCKKKNSFSHKKVKSFTIQPIFHSSTNSNPKFNSDTKFKNTDKSNEMQNFCCVDKRYKMFGLNKQIINNSLFNCSNQFKISEDENIINNNDEFISDNGLCQTILSRHNALFDNDYFTGINEDYLILVMLVMFSQRLVNQNKENLKILLLTLFLYHNKFLVNLFWLTELWITQVLKFG